MKGSILQFMEKNIQPRYYFGANLNLQSSAQTIIPYTVFIQPCTGFLLSHELQSTVGILFIRILQKFIKTWLSSQAPLQTTHLGVGIPKKYQPTTLLTDACPWLHLAHFFFVFQWRALISYQSHTLNSTLTVKPEQIFLQNNALIK